MNSILPDFPTIEEATKKIINLHYISSVDHETDDSIDHHRLIRAISAYPKVIFDVWLHYEEDYESNFDKNIVKYFGMRYIYNGKDSQLYRFDTIYNLLTEMDRIIETKISAD